VNSELEYLVLYLIKKHKDEIIKDADWWFGLPEYWVNVHDYFENNTFHINVYKTNEDGITDYSHWEDLPSLTLEELKAL